ncbi:MAG TPA: phosphohistidine phosphatase SixA [Candidatus Baltobacteraceae bacterium]|nr:phosphohistidine phosphatase SixA [Candidatus Baltobacteraceae bacterium]
MKLYFLRHGVAADTDGWKGSDAERPLTDEGRKSMEREAKALANLNLAPDVILTSPLVRAKQTAEIVAGRLHRDDRVIEDVHLAEAFDVNVLGQLLRKHGDAQAVMLVGHEPDFSRTIGELTGGARVDLKKGGLARVDLSDASSTSGELVWLIPPKVLVH